MDKRIVIGMALALFLVAAVFVSAHFEETEPVSDTGYEPVASGSCGAGNCGEGTCDGSCGGSCGVKTCGCGR